MPIATILSAYPTGIPRDSTYPADRYGTGWLARAANAGSAMAQGYYATQDLLGSTFGQMFGADFYNRVHIQFLELDLGNLVSDQTTGLWVWNAWRRAIVLDTLTLTNAEGITIGGQPAPPLQFGPQQQRTFELGISTDGPPTIDATVTFSFSGTVVEVLPVAVIGSRITGWSWAPDWAAGITESMEWATDVMTAYRGEEQRRALRLGPRKSVEFSTLATGQERRIMEAALWNWGARVWAVPMWWDGVDLADPLALGSVSIPVGTATRDFQAGGLAMLLGASALSFEVAEIEAVSSSAITLKRPTTKAWPAATRVYPAKACRLDPSMTAARFTAESSTARLRFSGVDPDTWTEDAGAATHRTYPVLEVPPSWASDVELSLERKLSILDNVTGKRRVRDEADLPAARQSMRWTFTSRAELDAWRKRLHALRGRHGAVWVPTWTDDLQVVLQIESAAAALDVQFCGYTLYHKLDPNRRDVRIQTASGQVFYRRITGSSVLDANTERLNLDAALGVTVPISEVRMVSYMMLARQESDTAELAWWTGEVADTAAAFRSFRHEF